MGAGSLRIAFPNVFLPPMTTIHAAVVLVTSGFFACSGGSSQPPGPPVDLVITGGNTQSWYFNNRLPTPLSVSPPETLTPGSRTPRFWTSRPVGIASMTAWSSTC